MPGIFFEWMGWTLLLSKRVWRWTAASCSTVLYYTRENTCGYCGSHCGRCVVYAPAPVWIVSALKGISTSLLSQWPASSRGGGGGSGLNSQLASLNHFSKGLEAWWKASTCGLAPVISGHTTSNSWWRFLHLPQRVDKRSLQNLRSTLYTWMLLGTTYQSLEEGLGHS